MQELVALVPPLCPRAFERERAWHRGLANNRTQGLAALFAYQGLLRYRQRHGRPHGQRKALLDRL